jgi:nicotinamide-nucleotide amidase
LIEILTIGNELLCGRTVDGNAAMIASELHAAGFAVTRITTTGDSLATIRNALLSCLTNTRFVIVTGGLGPTKDDLTAEAAAAAFNDTMALHPEALAMLEAWLDRRGRSMSASQQKQAMLPSTATPIANPVGTACGFIMHVEERHYLFLPGVPAEARAMTEQTVIDYINKHSGRNDSIKSKTLRIYGLWESIIQEKLSTTFELPPGVTLGFYPQFPEVHLRLSAKGPDASALQIQLEMACEAIRERIGAYIYAEEDITLPKTVGHLLADRGHSAGVAESCTGGLLSGLFTSVPGSSAWFDRGLVTYSNASKTQLAGVDDATLAQHGAVSEQTARALAQGVRRSAESTWGIGVTGIAGPDGGTPEKPVGTVFFAIDGPEGCRAFHRRFTGTREQIQMLSAHTALDLLRRILLNLPLQA